MNFFNSFILFTFFLLVSCGTNNTCSTASRVIYNLGFIGCDYLIEIDGVLYEPNNLNDWQNFIFYVDTQEVYIDYQFTNEFSTCSGLEKIDLYCLTNI